MKFGIKNEIDWNYVGALLANESDAEQVAFIKSFLRECKSWGTAHQVQIQLAYINEKLTKDEIETLKMVTYSEDEEQKEVK